MIKRGFYACRLCALLLLGLIGALPLNGCALEQNAHDSEQFISGNSYSASFPGTEAIICEAARRTLLSQGYIVTDAKPNQIKAIKNFQRGKDAHTEIEFTVVCASNSNGSNSATAFINAVRQTYSLRKSKNSASVGVSVLGSLSVPFGASDEALVKVGAETIESKIFYDQFFARLENYLDPVAVQKLIDENVDTVEPEVP
jgi:hypothetical protein